MESPEELEERLWETYGANIEAGVQELQLEQVIQLARIATALEQIANPLLVAQAHIEVDPTAREKR